MTFEEYKQRCEESGIESFDIDDDGGSEPLNCTPDAVNVIERSKLRALVDEFNAQSFSMDRREDRNFLNAQTALLRVRMAKPRLSGFVDELAISARNNSALSGFAFSLLS